jgi:hypothetical protein
MIEGARDKRNVDHEREEDNDLGTAKWPSKCGIRLRNDARCNSIAERFDSLREGASILVFMSSYARVDDHHNLD